ncbi:unnamed protein product [Ectocarpus sp. CCAP 1310/34]|nr:unnamed protein product [Ectocarpus sp. CCAP 1310/34]
MAQRREGGEVNSDEGRIGHSDHRGGGGSKSGGMDELSTGGGESAAKALSVKREVLTERPREEGKQRSGGDAEVGDSRQAREVLSTSVQQTSEDAQRTEAEVAGGKGGRPEGKWCCEGIAHAGRGSVSQKGGTAVGDLEKGCGGDQGPVKDENNRKRGADAQVEEDGGGGSASDEGGGGDGESLGGQPSDGGKEGGFVEEEAGRSVVHNTEGDDLATGSVASYHGEAADYLSTFSSVGRWGFEDGSTSAYD